MFLMKTWTLVYENSLDPWIPELWAQESLMVLEANMVMANLVHRDFSNEIAQFGDVVNTRQPGRFTMKRKLDSDSVTVQDATATNVAVKLNQHMHTTFIIKDGEESKGFKSLRDEYLVPALWSIAQGIDQVLVGEVYNFIGQSAGELGVAVTKLSLIDLREAQNKVKCPLQGRNLVITPDTEGALLNIADFTTADKIGDDGSVMREGSLGRRFGYNIFMAQNTPSLPRTNTTGDIEADIPIVDNAAGYGVGTTTMTIDGYAIAFVLGQWFTMENDVTPHTVISAVGGATPTSVTFLPPLKHAVVDNDELTVIGMLEVDLVAGYALDWPKALVVDGVTNDPVSGQLLSSGVRDTDQQIYGLIDDTADLSLVLNRSLDAALVDGQDLFPGPEGEFNFAFHRNALTLVSRPLAIPASGTGALAAVASFNGLSIRVVITYDGDLQGHRVTVDLLCGVKVLDTDLGAVLYG